METEQVLRIDDLVKHQGAFVLDIPGLVVDSGAVVGLVGVNGSGKTTLMGTMLGLVRPDSGSVCIFGIDTVGKPDAMRSAKERIGVVFDTVAFPKECRIDGVGGLGRSSFRSWDDERFAELLRRFDLGSGMKVAELSRGMGMKLSLAFALAHDPDLLLLDEATAGLDPIARDGIHDLLRAFMEQEGKTIVMASHISSDIDSIADRVICIDEGRIIFDEPREAITDLAGIARCRRGQFDELATSRYAEEEDLRCISRTNEIDVLVPDRFEFICRFPDILCEPATVDEYMRICVKGKEL